MAKEQLAESKQRNRESEKIDRPTAPYVQATSMGPCRTAYWFTLGQRLLGQIKALLGPMKELKATNHQYLAKSHDAILLRHEPT